MSVGFVRIFLAHPRVVQAASCCLLSRLTGKQQAASVGISLKETCCSVSNNTSAPIDCIFIKFSECIFCLTLRLYKQPLMLIFSDPIYPKRFEISYPGTVCSRWSRQMILPNTTRNLVSKILVSSNGCTSSLLFLYKQPVILWYWKKISHPNGILINPNLPF